jgi:hypothetical protein
MPYARAQEYAEIYDLQDNVDVAQKQGARDAVLSIGLFADGDVTDPAGSIVENQSRKQHIQAVQGQLFLIESMVTALDAEYKKFLAAHPE